MNEFDLNDAIDRTATTLNINKDAAARVVKQFLEETEAALAEHGRIEYMNHFSISLKKRAARSGTLKGKAWSTPERVEPEFQASKKLKARIEEIRGIPCV